MHPDDVQQEKAKKTDSVSITLSDDIEEDNYESWQWPPWFQNVYEGGRARDFRNWLYERSRQLFEYQLSNDESPADESPEDSVFAAPSSGSLVDHYESINYPQGILPDETASSNFTLTYNGSMPPIGERYETAIDMEQDMSTVTGSTFGSSRSSTVSELTGTVTTLSLNHARYSNSIDEYPMDSTTTEQRGTNSPYATIPSVSERVQGYFIHYPPYDIPPSVTSDSPSSHIYDTIESRSGSSYSSLITNERSNDPTTTTNFYAPSTLTIVDSSSNDYATTSGNSSYRPPPSNVNNRYRRPARRRRAAPGGASGCIPLGGGTFLSAWLYVLVALFVGGITIGGILGIINVTTRSSGTQDSEGDNGSAPLSIIPTQPLNYSLTSPSTTNTTQPSTSTNPSSTMKWTEFTSNKTTNPPTTASTHPLPTITSSTGKTTPGASTTTTTNDNSTISTTTSSQSQPITTATTAAAGTTTTTTPSTTTVTAKPATSTSETAPSTAPTTPTATAETKPTSTSAYETTTKTTLPKTSTTTAAPTTTLKTTTSTSTTPAATTSTTPTIPPTTTKSTTVKPISTTTTSTPINPTTKPSTTTAAPTTTPASTTPAPPSTTKTSTTEKPKSTTTPPAATSTTIKSTTPATTTSAKPTTTDSATTTAQKTTTGATQRTTTLSSTIPTTNPASTEQSTPLPSNSSTSPISPTPGGCIGTSAHGMYTENQVYFWTVHVYQSLEIIAKSLNIRSGVDVLTLTTMDTRKLLNLTGDYNSDLDNLNKELRELTSSSRWVQILFASGPGVVPVDCSFDFTIRYIENRDTPQRTIERIALEPPSNSAGCKYNTDGLIWLSVLAALYIQLWQKWIFLN